MLLRPHLQRQRRAARRHLEQDRRRRPRGAQPHLGDRRLRPHRLAALGHGGGAGHAGHLQRRHRRAGARQTPAGSTSTSSSGRRTWSRSTSTASRATANLFGAEEFARMKPGAVFLNLSRGIVVDHDALAASLKSGPRRRRGGGRVSQRARRQGAVLEPAARLQKRHPHAAHRRPAPRRRSRTSGSSSPRGWSSTSAAAAPR